jgi:hypothetical protein
MNNNNTIAFIVDVMESRVKLKNDKKYPTLTFDKIAAHYTTHLMMNVICEGVKSIKKATKNREFLFHSCYDVFEKTIYILVSKIQISVTLSEMFRLSERF